MNNSRLEEISLYIKERKKVSLDELCIKFSISLSTLRRDLKKLEDTGSIQKIYGGVKTRTQRELTPLSTRIDINHTGKFKIARHAASSIVDGDIIFLDSGSTAGAMAQFLARPNNLTVVTNNILVIEKVIHFPKIHLITLSGLYNRNTFSFVGDEVAPMLRHYNISKAFMGTTGFSPTSGITHSTQLEASVKRCAVNIAQNVYLLADHLKFDAFAPYTYCTLDDIDKLYTDAPLSEDYAKLCQKHHTEVIICNN